MSVIPACPLCASENTYQDGELFICPDCAHEWNPAAQEVEVEAEPV
ncbi:alkylphosphonate utilization protein, partial [Acinetobacter baumannii]